MRDLVFVKFNSRLKQKRERKDRDPIVKEIDDVLLDNGNEFITGVYHQIMKIKKVEIEQQQKHNHNPKGRGLCNQGRRKFGAFSL